MYSKQIYRLSSTDTDEQFLHLSKLNPVIVDFFAPWCGPCKKLSPLLEKATKENKITLFTANVDECSELATKYKVTGIPHVILFIDGKEEMSFVGCDEGKLAEMIKRAKEKVNLFVGKGISIGTSVEAQSNTDNTPIPSEPTFDGDNVLEIMFKYNDKVFKRKFYASNLIKEVKAYVRKEVNAGNVMIFSPFPRKVYDNDFITLQEAGLSKRESLNVSLQ